MLGGLLRPLVAAVELKLDRVLGELEEELLRHKLLATCDSADSNRFDLM